MPWVPGDMRLAGHFGLQLGPIKQFLASRAGPSSVFRYHSDFWHLITDNFLGSNHFLLCTHSTQIGGNFTPENQLAQTRAR